MRNELEARYKAATSMRTEVVRVDPSRPEPDVVARAVEVLRAGGLVVLPTETVYGLAALADDPVAAARIFDAKGRPAFHPLIVHVEDAERARTLAASWPGSADALANLWPGPLTLVVPRDPTKIPDVVAGHGPTVAFRVPSSPVMLAVLRALGRPLAAPSANRYQTVSPTTAEHARKTLDGRAPLILDAGPSLHGIESTVVDCTQSPPRVLRPGAVSLASLRAVVPEVDCVHIRSSSESVPLPSPGLSAKHYAPRARLIVVSPESIEKALQDLRGHASFLVLEGRPHLSADPRVRVLPMDPEAYGAGLYAALHALDEGETDTIVVEAVPEEDAWLAVRDRLTRAES